MNRAVLFGILLLILENGLVPWLVPTAWSGRLTPHLVFVLMIYVASFSGRHGGFFFGIGFGLLMDILNYGSMIGPYAFGMGLVGYATGLALERRPPGLAGMVTAAAICSVGLGSMIYLIYRLFSLTSWPYIFAFYWNIAPTMLLETLIALVLYFPVRRYLLKAIPSSQEEPAA
jgi:rod shape-determining protein MreD